MRLLKVECLLMLFCFTTGLSACGGDEDEPIKNDVPTPELYGPKHGTGWVEHTYDYYIQKPWNLNLEERYTYDKENDEHTFKIIKGDEPFKQGDPILLPVVNSVCEMIIQKAIINLKPIIM